MLAPYTEFTGGNPGPLVPADVCCGRRLRPRVPEERATASRSAVSVGLKSESARMERALSADWSGLRTLAVRAVPCDPRNVRPGDADIGQFAVSELVQLVEARIVAPPGLEEVEDCDQHDLCLSIPGRRRVILVGAKIRFHAASQQSSCCDAAMSKMQCSSHCIFTKIKRFQPQLFAEGPPAYRVAMRRSRAARNRSRWPRQNAPSSVE